MAAKANWWQICDCGSVDNFVNGNDGFFYCNQCHVRNEALIDMEIAREDIVGKNAIYIPKFCSRRSFADTAIIKAQPKPISQFATGRSIPRKKVSRHPEVKWAQTVDTVIITVLLFDPKNPKTNLESDGVFTFTATSEADKIQYELKLDLYSKVNVQKEIKTSVGGRSVLCILEKAEQGWWKKLVCDQKTPHYIKVDWDKWVDEDEDDDSDTDLSPAKRYPGEMDFSENMSTSEDSDDDDDEDEVTGASTSPPRKCRRLSP